MIKGDRKLMFQNKKTSIIILTYNNLNYNQICLESVRKYTSANTYEIIVVDNNSTDGTREWLKQQNDIKLILNNENLGFPKGCNLGIGASGKGNDILFLNNDTKVTPRWLDNLKICLYSDEKIGATGSITNCCSNYQDINVPYKDIENMIEFADKNNISSSDKWEQKNKLIGFCILVKREVIDKIGIFDEQFTPGNCEDDDLSMRIIESGYKLMLCHDSFIHHFGSASFNKDYAQYNHILRTNSLKFEEKWGFNFYYKSALKFDVIGNINEPIEKELNILEFDCGLGSTLLRLKYMYPHTKLYGIETNKNAAHICGKMLEVMIEDFEKNYIMNFKEDTSDYFDYIILGNRLQFSIDPWKLLNEIKKFLKPGGYVIATIPNVMHYSIIKGLLSGDFIYNTNSILNRNYNKFFTLSDIYKMFDECGYINSYMYRYYNNERTHEDDKFVNEICSIVGENMKGQFLFHEYIAKFQKNI